jgi:SAM-dependent MidA family methyltransferase
LPRETPAGRLLRDEIASTGPISFERFMDVALYHPEFGYYRSRDPFGRNGDFYTAAQLQPVFGQIIRAIAEDSGAPPVLLDVGAGRGEMREAFDGWTYIPIDSGDAWPDPLVGFLLANELFDALPVRVFNSQDDEVLVDWRNGEFTFTSAPHHERSPRVDPLVRQMARTLRRGSVLILDYGYVHSDRDTRFPAGSLMSYRRHVASSEVLLEPGERDITAHVDFTALEETAARHGFRTRRRCTLQQMILSLGERRVQQIAAVSGVQLKTLLFGMGETFTAVLLDRDAGSANID